VGSADLGPGDGGPGDLGPPDVGPPDTGSPDLGAPDLGPADVGPGEDLGTRDAGPDGGGADLGEPPPDLGDRDDLRPPEPDGANDPDTADAGGASLPPGADTADDGCACAQTAGAAPAGLVGAALLLLGLFALRRERSAAAGPPKRCRE